MIGRAAFLFPVARIEPRSGRPPSMTKDSIRVSATTVSGTGLVQARRPKTQEAILNGPMDVTRDRAWETLTRYTQSEALRRHARAVEACVGFYARESGANEALARGCAPARFRLRDAPDARQHPQDGAPILREEGVARGGRRDRPSHAEHLELPRDTPLKKTLFACDELAGFVHACGLVRPDGIETLEPKSVKKKLKQPSFAAGVHRTRSTPAPSFSASSSTTTSGTSWRRCARSRPNSGSARRRRSYAVKRAWARRASVSRSFGSTDSRQMARTDWTNLPERVNTATSLNLASTMSNVTTMLIPRGWQRLGANVGGRHARAVRESLDDSTREDQAPRLLRGDLVRESRFRLSVVELVSPRSVIRASATTTSLKSR